MNRSLLIACLSVVLPCAVQVLASTAPEAQLVRSRVRLDDGNEPYERCLGALDRFGSSLASLGDLNGDGLDEFAVGASGDFRDAGSVWIFSLTNDRQVQRFVKLGPRENLPLPAKANDEFGTAVVALGDLDGNGVGDLAVGAPGTDVNSGAVHILYLTALGAVREQRVFSRATGFPGLENGGAFGLELAAPGDLDRNRVPDLLVGQRGSSQTEGGLWVLYLGPGGTLLSSKRIALSQLNLSRLDALGVVGDVLGTGPLHLVAGSSTSLRLVELDANENVRNSRVLTSGSLVTSAVGLGDVDGNGVPDFAAGRTVYRLNSNATVLGQQTIPASEPGFGDALAAPGDTNGDGRLDLVVGHPLKDTRGRDLGSITFYDLRTDGVAEGPQTIDGNSSRLTIAPAPLGNSDSYGVAIAPLGDLDLDGQAEVAVGAPADSDVATATGAVWLHFTRGNSGTRVAKLGAKFGALGLQSQDGFGASLASLGDLDGNGTTELMVGAPGDDDGATNAGAAYVLFLRRTGTIDRFQKISLSSGGFVPGVGVRGLGQHLETISDLDGDGRSEVLLSAELETFVLFLAADGRVRSSTRLDRSRLPGLGANTGLTMAWMPGSASDSKPRLMLSSQIRSLLWSVELDSSGQIATARQRSLALSVRGLETLGDLDGNGYTDLALLGGSEFLHFWFMGADFAVQSEIRVRAVESGGLGALGDLTGDGVPDLAAGFFSVDSGHDRVLLLELDGLATAAFERRDALDNFALENGRQIPRPHPGRTFVISSGGANLGAAIFDSTPGGPNAASQDPDLLVGSGNVLMLQDSLTGTQSVPSIFDRPNDDRDGGLLALDLPRPVKPLSLELIDQDSGLGHGTTVTLIDENGRTRTYDVPPGFTEDVNQTHSGGWRTLRLDTLVPQPGYLATATASEQPGFLANRVRRLEVQLSGSGAIDDFLYDPWP